MEVSPDFGFYRVRYREEEHPLVSIIIPNHEQRETLQKCIDAIHAHTDYRRYEVIVVENNSSSREILSYYKSIQGKTVCALSGGRVQRSISRLFAAKGQIRHTETTWSS